MALKIGSGVTKKDPELERQLFDENTIRTEESSRFWQSIGREGLA